jgi:predicted permease
VRTDQRQSRRALTAAALVIRFAAFLVPSDRRAAWREEWLAELGHNRGRNWQVWGAVWDAWLLRRAIWPPLRAPAGGWAADLRDAVRALRRAPIQAIALVACLAVGTTLTVVVAGVLNAMLGGDLPGIDQRRTLVTMRAERTRDGRIGNLIGADYKVLPAELPGLAAWGSETETKRLAVAAGGIAGVVRGAFVSGAYFQVLGTRPALGRLLQPADDHADAPPVVVIGHHFWQRHFGSRPDAIGSTIQLATSSFTVVGVAPAGFVGTTARDIGKPADTRGEVWLPLSHSTRIGFGVGIYDYTSAPVVVARLAPGIDRVEAQAAVQPLTARFNGARATLDERNREAHGQVVGVHLLPLRLLPFDGGELAAVALVFGTLASVPLIVLAIACANVAGIQLARAIGRTHELAVRVSLGASRGRIARLLAMETGLVALAAAGIGALLANVLLERSSAILPMAPIFDARLVMFAILVPIAITLVAGLLPAWRATGFDVVSGLRLGARVGRVASPRLRRFVVAAQMTLSVGLLVPGGALLEGLSRLDTVIGPMHDDVLTAEAQFSYLGLDEPAERRARAEIVRRVTALPGVDELALSPRTVFLSSGGDGVCAPGVEPPAHHTAWRLVRFVTPNFFDAMGIPVRVGRVPEPADARSAVVVNEAFVRGLPDPATPLGQPVLVGREPSVIVGVVADSYERYPSGRPSARCYVVWTDEGPQPGAVGASAVTLFVRTRQPSTAAVAIREILRDVDPRLAPAEIGTIRDVAHEHYRTVYAATAWLTLAGVLALGLAGSGLFGVLSYGAAQRTHEFAVRVALGARPARIAGALAREAVGLVGAGAAVGLVLTVPLVWFLSGGLRSISLANPGIWVVTVLLLAAISLVASIRPMRRVSHPSLLDALRES